MNKIYYIVHVRYKASPDESSWNGLTKISPNFDSKEKVLEYANEKNIDLEKKSYYNDYYGGGFDNEYIIKEEDVL